MLAGIDHAQEASTFVALNVRRQRLSQSDIFHGMLAAGDGDAKAVAEILAETGWTVRRHGTTAAYHPGDLGCAPMLVKRLRSSSAATVRFGLTVMRAAWPDKPVRQGATILHGLFHLYDNLLDDHPRLTSAALIEAIGQQTPEGWLLNAEILRERRPTLSGPAALAMVILDDATGPSFGRPAPAVPVPLAVPAPVPQIATAPATLPAPRPVTLRDNAFGKSGKGWCEQCERLCTRDQATACRTPFCKLKVS